MLKYIFSSTKTASKCVNLSTISKSQRGWGFDGNVIFTKSLKFHYPQIRLPQKVWSSKKIQVPCRRKFWCQCNLYRVKKSYFPQVLVAMQVYQVLEVVFHLKKDCLKMCEPQHNFKVTKGRRFWWKCNFYQVMEIPFPTN